MADRFSFRARILHDHLNPTSPHSLSGLSSQPCFSYTSPDLSEPPPLFDTNQMRALLDSHDIEFRDWLFGLMTQSQLFNPKTRGHRIFVSPDYNQPMEQQREITLKRIEYLRDCGAFKGGATGLGQPEVELRMLALNEVMAMFDHSLANKIVFHFFLWGGAIKFLGTKYHERWLKGTEDYRIKGCFAMSELGHGSNVRGIETSTTYDPNTQEFIINTPSESAQKYWIGGVSQYGTHAVVFSQLNVEGKNQGVHAFIVQLRDEDGKVCPNICIADCGHMSGLNGVDNAAIWFDNIRIPRENLLNYVADVSPDGRYLTTIKDNNQRFGVALATLTSGRVHIAVSAIYVAKVGLATAIRYSLSRRAFSLSVNEGEVLLLDYPSHQRRLLPLLAETYAMSFAGNYLKSVYVKRTPETNKTIHIISSALKATHTWHNLRTLQECREACGGQGMKTENRIGILRAEYDVHSTFEGDNNVLMQRVSRALLEEYMATQKNRRPFKGLWLEHMNNHMPVIPSLLSGSNLRCSKFQTDVFCLRERDLLDRFAVKFSANLKQGRSKEYAFAMDYQLGQDLGRAFADKAILFTCLEVEAKTTPGPLKEVLCLLRSLYALIIMEEDASFLRYGYLSVENDYAVRKEVMKLCSELRLHSLALVNSFGIPDAFLGPIAFWVHANSLS